MGLYYVLKTLTAMFFGFGPNPAEHDKEELFQLYAKDVTSEPLRTEQVELYPSRFEFDVSNWEMLEEPPGWGHSKITLHDRNCSRVIPGPPTPTYPQILKKKVFAPVTRFIFILGLEGTGHHLMNTVFKACHSCSCIYEWQKPKQDEFGLVKHENHHGLFGSMMTKQDIANLVKRFKRDAPTLKMKYSGKNVILNTLCAKELGQGMMSYPNFIGQCHKLQYPAVRILAEMFENAGMDLRIVVMVRDALDVLLSTSVNREFAPWERNAKLYINLMRKIINDQLGRLDKKFYMCLEYDQLPTLPEGIDEFLGFSPKRFDFSATIKSKFQPRQDLAAIESNKKLYAAKDKDKLYLELQELVDQLRIICSHSNRTSDV